MEGADNKRKVVTDADDAVEPAPKVQRQEPELPKALQARSEEQLATMHELFSAAPSKKYPGRFNENKEWILSNSRLVLQDKATSRPAQFKSGYLSAITVFHPQEITAGSAYKVSISVSVNHDEFLAASQSDEAYAAASDTVKMIVDMVNVHHVMLKAALVSVGIKSMMTKEALKSMPKKKSIEELFDADVYREGGRPNKFSVTVGESIRSKDDAEIHEKTFRFSLYMSTKPDSTASGPTELASDIVGSLPANCPLAEWCRLNPDGRLRTDVFSTPAGPLPLSLLVKHAMISTPKASFHKVSGIINLGLQAFSFAAKPNLFTTSVFPRGLGICVHTHQAQARSLQVSMSDEDRAIYDAV